MHRGQGPPVVTVYPKFSKGCRTARYYAHCFSKLRFCMENPLHQASHPLFSRPLMSKNAGLAKTRKSVAKRFKITGTGKILRRRQGKRHLLQNKGRKRKRSLGKAVLVHGRDAAAVRANMPWS